MITMPLFDYEAFDRLAQLQQQNLHRRNIPHLSSLAPPLSIKALLQLAKSTEAITPAEVQTAGMQHKIGLAQYKRRKTDCVQMHEQEVTRSPSIRPHTDARGCAIEHRH